jgi:hypothetical protein
VNPRKNLQTNGFSPFAGFSGSRLPSLPTKTPGRSTSKIATGFR